MKVDLQKMNQEEFDKFYDFNRKDIIEDIKKEGDSEDIATQKFEQMWHSLVKDGFKDKRNHFLNIINNEKLNIGYMWLTEKNVRNVEFMFLSSIFIYQDYRRNGYAKLALNEMEKFIKSVNINEIRFQVNGDNDAAINLYNNSGYKTSRLLMKKEI